MGLSQHKLCHLIQVVAMDAERLHPVGLSATACTQSNTMQCPTKWMVHGQEPQEEILQELLLQACPHIKLLMQVRSAQYLEVLSHSLHLINS